MNNDAPIVVDWKWIGLRLRDVRIQRKISLHEMSDLIHLKDCSLSNIEHNKARPSLEALIRIVVILDVSLDYIVLGIHPPHRMNGLIFRANDELDRLYALTEE